MRPFFAKAIPTKYVTTNSNPTPAALNTEALKSSQHKTPRICGTEIKGISVSVATGLQIPFVPYQKTEFLESASRAGESGRSGRSVGFLASNDAK